MGIATTIRTRDGLAVATDLGYEVLADIEFDSDYAASGGEPLDPHADLLFPKEASIVSVACAAAGGFVFDYDPTTSKIIAYWVDTSVDGAPMAEVTAGANGLDGVVARMRFVATVS